MKALAKRALLKAGYKIGPNRKIIPCLFRDIYKSGATKKVLLSYVTAPFYTESKMAHSNYDECRIAAEAFNALGYSVDAIEYNEDLNVDYSEYDVVYGMGPNFEKSFFSTSKKLKRIFYATGCNPNYSNSATILRLRDFAAQKGNAPVESTRFIRESQHCQILLSDTVIVLGNDFVLRTYTDLDPSGSGRYRRLNAFYYDVNQPAFPIDYSTRRNNFLWFGSSGLIHKGLDILLDFFATRPELRLHVCGVNQNESQFIQLYDRELRECGNIINHGFVHLQSEEFRSIARAAGFVIFPSVSEGGAPAVLNAIANGGAIPLLTRSTGLDVEDFGKEIHGFTTESIRRVIEEVQSMSDVALARMSEKACRNVRSEYTIQTYASKLSTLIAEALAA